MKYIFGENGCPKYVNLKKEYKKCNIEFVERSIYRLKNPPEDRVRPVLASHLGPVMPGIKMVRSDFNLSPSSMTPSWVKPDIFLPKWVEISLFAIAPNKPFTALGPSLCPGLGMGAKKASLNLSRIFCFLR